MINQSNVSPQLLLSLNFTMNNRTTTPAPKSTNKLMASVTIVFIALTLLFNGLILAGFIKRPHLRTPFNCYVINLAFVDVLTALVPMLMIVITQMVGYWPSNRWTCTLLLYIGNLALGGNRAAHLLIAANRLWAVTFPLAYRYRHTKRLAVQVTLLAWALTICLVTPRNILGRRNFNYSWSAPDPDCAYDLKAYPAFSMANNVIIFNIPEVLILIAYPWMLFKLRQQMLTRPIRSVGPGRHEKLDCSTSAASSSKSHAAQLTREEEPEDRQSMRRFKPSSRTRGHNRLFAYLVLAVICCWTPNHVLFLWSGITGFWNDYFFDVQFFLSFGNSWLNPILIYVADLQLRKTVNEFIRCR